MRACRISVRRCGSICPIRPGARRCMTAAAPVKLLAVFCANVIHIAPWRVAEGLFAGAGRYLRADGRLFLYGPFKRDGKHTAVSNAVFDTSLARTRSPNGACAISSPREAGGRRRSCADRNRRDARQQSHSGVRATRKAVTARRIARARLRRLIGRMRLSIVRAKSMRVRDSAGLHRERKSADDRCDAQPKRSPTTPARAPMWCALPRRRR